MASVIGIMSESALVVLRESEERDRQKSLFEREGQQSELQRLARR